jgi:phosphoribosylanthranilate isomerase
VISLSGRVMTKIKICGITNIEDAIRAVNLGADALGFVFYKDSPRYIREDTVRKITRELPPFVSSVGVFVNEKEDRVREISESCSLDILQFHGNESPDFCSHFDKKVIKAFSINNRKELKIISSYKVSAVLLDTYYEDIYGGGGKTFNWKLASEAKRFASRVILAGGLNPANVMEAIQMVEPYGVDVSSGVESKPGKKDPVKLEKFIKIIKKAYK